MRKNDAAPDLRLEAEWRREKNARVPNAAVSATRIWAPVGPFPDGIWGRQLYLDVNSSL